jgi:hypothetical protein
VRIEADVTERHLTIVECRLPWRAETGAEWTQFPVARLRYTKATRLWSLYWRDRNLRFHEYDLVPASANVEELLADVDRDPTAIFLRIGELGARRHGLVGEQVRGPCPVECLAGPVVDLVGDS